MVQILQNRDAINQILKGTAAIAPDALSQFEKAQEQKKAKALQAKQSAALSRFLGEDVSQLSPDVQKSFAQERFKGMEEERRYDKFYPKGGQDNTKEGFTLDDYEKLSSEGRAKFAKFFPKENSSFQADLKQKRQSERLNEGEREISPDQQVKIDAVLESPEWEKASATKKNQLLLQSGISRANTKQIMDVEQKSDETLTKQSFEEKKLNRKETAPLRAKYAEEAKFGASASRDAKYLNRILEKGDVDSPAYVWLTTFMPEQLQDSLLSDDTQLYRSGLFQSFAQLRQMFSGQTRTKEIDLLEDKIAGLEKTHGAKKKINDASIMRAKGFEILGKHAAEVEREMPYLGPSQFEQEVQRRAEPEMEKLYQNIMDKYVKTIAEESNQPIVVVFPNGKEVTVDKKDLAGLFREAREQDMELRFK